MYPDLDWHQWILLAVFFNALSYFVRWVEVGVNERASEPELNPYLTQKELPFDKNLAAIGVLEPEIRTVTDWAAWDKANPPDTTVVVPSDMEAVWELGSRYPVMLLDAKTGEPVKAKIYPNPPTRTELHWKNTLAGPA